jgi:hypothetical protein
MQVQNIECQIAKAQIGHYLAGAGLSEEAMSQLEEHISGCPECKAALAERRAELLALLAEEAKAAPELMEEPVGAANSIAAALRQKSIEKLAKRAAPAPVAAIVETPPTPEPTPVAAAPTPKPTATPVATTVEASAVKPNNFWKPLLYSLALGAVLVGMSLFSKNTGGILGNKLSETLPAATNAAPTAIAQPVSNTTTKTTPVVDTPKATTPDPIGPPEAPKQTSAPVETPPKPISTAPTQPAIQAAPRPQTAPTVAPKTAPATKKVPARRLRTRGHRQVRRTPIPRANRPAQPRPSGIRIYDQSGRPL